MNKIEKMIKEICPSGVKYLELGDVVKVNRGKSLSKSDKGTGNNPIILYGELYTTYGDYINKIFSYASDDAVKNATVVNEGDILLPLSSTTKEAQIGKASVLCVESVYLGGDALALMHEQNAAYLMYVINGKEFEREKMKCVKGTTIQHLSVEKMLKIKIPVPPIEVQSEIVRILDNFTELTAELTARNKQYEYYRNKLLDFGNGGGA